MNTSKILLTALVIPFLTIVSQGQNCDTITAGATISSKTISMDVLSSTYGHNALSYRVNSSESGSLDEAVRWPLISSLNLWICGIDPNGNINLVTGIENDQDWSMGPGSFDDVLTDTDCATWDRTFNYSIEDVATALSVIEKGLPCTDIPSSIREWPAYGNVFASVPVDDDYVLYATFYDVDGDGIYEPCDGDLPRVPKSSNFIGGKMLNQIPAHVSYHVRSINTMPEIETGHPAQIQVGTYACTFHSQEAEDIILLFHDIFSYEKDDLRKFYVSNRVDFDMECIDEMALGSYPELDMVYAHSSPATDDTCDQNSARRQAVGVSILKGLYVPKVFADLNGETILVDPINEFADTLIEVRSTSISIPTDCDLQSDDCSLETASQVHNIMSGLHADGDSLRTSDGQYTNYQFVGEPTDAHYDPMCTQDVNPQTVAYLNMGGGTVQPGARSISVSAIMTTDDGGICSEPTALKYKYKEATNLLARGLYQNIGPQAPKLIAKQYANRITLKLEDIPYAYEDELPLYSTITDRHYSFEGVKIYQVSSSNFDMNLFNNINNSAIVYQGDLVNDIDDIYNWIEISWLPSSITFPNLQVNAANDGITEDLITITSDRLTGLPLNLDKDYYFVALSYGHNDYMTYHPIENIGQRFPYIETSYGKTVTTAEKITPTVEVQLEKILSQQGSTLVIADYILEPDIDIVLYSVSGQLIHSWKGVTGGQRIDLSILESSAGIYIAVVRKAGAAVGDGYKVIIY